MAQGGVKFARIHGRIVPIRAKTQSDRNAQYKSSLKTGLAAGAAIGVGSAVATGAQRVGSKFGMALGFGLQAAGAGLGLYTGIRSIVRGANAQKGTRGRTFAGNYFSGVAGNIAGQAAGFGGMVAGGLALRGFRKAGGVRGIATKVAGKFARKGVTARTSA